MTLFGSVLIVFQPQVTRIAGIRKRRFSGGASPRLSIVDPTRPSETQKSHQRQLVDGFRSNLLDASTGPNESVHRALFCRLDLNNPPTAVGGFQRTLSHLRQATLSDPKTSSRPCYCVGFSTHFSPECYSVRRPLEIVYICACRCVQSTPVLPIVANGVDAGDDNQRLEQ